MASNTPNLNLLKKDPATDGNDTFNIQTMLNDNWDKIDAAVGEVREELKDINVPDASLTQKGITQLSSATDSTAEDRAATPKAVKAAFDVAAAAQSTANMALPKSGGTISGNLAVTGTLTVGGVDIKAALEVGIVKSIQRFYVELVGHTKQVNVTILPVNTSKTVLNYLGVSCTATDSSNSFITLRLISSTTVEVNRAIAATDAKVSFEVIEFN
ncbi:phage tail protein [Paenibacillus sp. FSL R5-0527]|uniref:phage tail protein n=1 Tax=Paenibacillus sp. FSL R5-0527 TaxID=2975321 RepID=UPI00097A9AE9|nr:hypothetical protein BK140_10000 [Paenibacillus macerans]